MPKTFLLSAPSDSAHAFMMLAMAEAIARSPRGHRAIFLGRAELEEAVRAAGATFMPFEHFQDVDLASVMRPLMAEKMRSPLPAWLPRGAAPFARGRQRELTFRRQLLASAARMAHEMASVLRQVKPDALVVDCFCFGARYGAEMTGTPFVTAAVDPTFALNEKGTLALPPDPRMLRIPGAPWRWAVNTALPMQRVRKALGLPAQRRTAEFYSIMVSDTLHLSTSIPEMMRVPPPAGHRFVGPMQFDWPPPSSAPAGRAFAEGTILVTGTTTGRPPAIATFVQVAKAVASLGRPTAIVAGGAPGFPKDLGPHVRVFDSFISHAELIPHARVLLTHGGWGAVGRALRAGIPMLVIPGFGPQPMVGQRLAELGLARYLPPEQVSAERLQSEIDAILADTDMHTRLAAMKVRLAEMDSGSRVVEALESI